MRAIKLFFKAVAAILLVTLAQFASAQSAKERAHDKGVQAVKLEDEGKFDDAIKLLQEAERLDPDNQVYPYEIGYSYYAQKEYKKALDIFKKLISYKNATDQNWQMLGNTYDELGESDKAIKTYDDGLKKFPKSGKLYLEKGNVYFNKKEYDKALPLYEQGIEADPAFASNYYRATLIFCATKDPVWGMLYGEIFMNIERNSQRTSNISKLLYDTYKDNIKFKGNDSTSVEVTFCHDAVLDASAMKHGKITLPFGNICYEMNMALAVVGEKEIDINSLDRIRRNFLTNYFKGDNSKKYPNILFDYQKKIEKSGNLEAYNHWILMKGDEDAFGKWQAAHKDKWDAFVKWFTDNPMQVDESHRFYRQQYD